MQSNTEDMHRVQRSDEGSEGRETPDSQRSARETAAEVEPADATAGGRGEEGWCPLSVRYRSHACQPGEQPVPGAAYP